MAQAQITILRVRKNTRNRLRKLALAKRESYDEIINRLMEEEEGGADDDSEDLEERKQKLLKKGIDKELVDLLGVIPVKLSLKDEKRAIRKAIIRRLVQ